MIWKETKIIRLIIFYFDSLNLKETKEELDNNLENTKEELGDYDNDVQ